MVSKLQIGKIKNQWFIDINFHLTQESIVGIRLEKFFRSVEIETEWQKDLYVGFLLKQGWVSRTSVFQLIDANRVVASGITLGIQRIHYLCVVLCLWWFLKGFKEQFLNVTNAIKAKF